MPTTRSSSPSALSTSGGESHASVASNRSDNQVDSFIIDLRLSLCSRYGIRRVRLMPRLISETPSEPKACMNPNKLTPYEADHRVNRCQSAPQVSPSHPS